MAHIYVVAHCVPPPWSLHMTFLLRFFRSHMQDIVCPEAVKVDDLDPDAVAANYEAAKARVAEAEAGSAAAAEALIEVEVNKAMGGALGLAMA